MPDITATRDAAGRISYRQGPHPVSARLHFSFFLSSTPQQLSAPSPLQQSRRIYFAQLVLATIMADTDEAAIHMPSQDGSAHIEVDLSDETQDFRMLSNISL